MTNLMAIGVKMQKIDSGCSFEKEFIEMNHLSPRMIHEYICAPLI